MIKQFSENAELVYNYDNGFSLVREDSIVYLVKLDIVASIDANYNVIIQDRDKLNVFIDDFKDLDNLDKLSDEEVSKLLIDCLDIELTKKLTFSFDDTEIRYFISKYSDEQQEIIYDALDKMEVFSKSENKFISKLRRITTEGQMKFSSEIALNYFAKLNLERFNYDICSRTSEGKYKVIAKNGATGTFKKMSNNYMIGYFIFEKTPDINSEISRSTQNETNIDNNIIYNKVKQDLTELTSYKAANQFVKEEEQLNKLIEAIIENITSQGKSIDLTKIYYPSVDFEIEQVASLVRKHQSSKTGESLKLEIENELVKLYSKIEKEFSLSKNSIKKLQNV